MHLSPNTEILAAGFIGAIALVAVLSIFLDRKLWCKHDWKPTTRGHFKCDKCGQEDHPY